MSFSALKKARQAKANANNAQQPANANQNANSGNPQQNAQTFNQASDHGFYDVFDAQGRPFKIPQVDSEDSQYELCEKSGFMGYKGKNSKNGLILGYANVNVETVSWVHRLDSNGQPMFDSNGNPVWDEVRSFTPMKATVPLYASEPEHLEYIRNRKNDDGSTHVFSAEFTVYAYDDYHGIDRKRNTSFVFKDKDGNKFDKAGNKLK